MPKRTPDELMSFLYGEEDAVDIPEVVQRDDWTSDLLSQLESPSAEDEQLALRDDEREVVGEPFLPIRRRDRSQPLCFGRMHTYDSEAPDCRYCEFSRECESTGQMNRKRYQEWFDRHGIGTDDVGIVAHREVLLPVRGVAALPSPAKEPPTSPDCRAILGAIRGYWLRTSALTERRQLRRDREYQAARRANPTTADVLERYRNRRVRLLKEALASTKLDRRLQQIRGREGELGLFWKAMKSVSVRLGRTPSDAELAQEATECGMPLSRHQARGRRLLIADLERTGGPWAGLPAEELLPSKPSKRSRRSTQARD